MDRNTTRMIELSASSGRANVTLSHGTYMQQGGAIVDFGTMELTYKKDNTKFKVKREPALKLSAAVSAALGKSSEAAVKGKSDKDGDIVMADADQSTFEDPGKGAAMLI